MARFVLELPTQLIDTYKNLYTHVDDMLGEMTKAGAEVVMNNIRANVPKSFLDSGIMHNLYMTRTYKTPTDDGINTKVGFYGYFTNKDGVLTPAPLVANVFEYGRSDSPFPKSPFLRKSFRRGEIKEAMLKVQREWGVTDE